MLYIAEQPIIQVARANKYQRGWMLASSVKTQKHLLTMAQSCMSKGDTFHCRLWLDCLKKERQAYKLALSWQNN